MNLLRTEWLKIRKYPAFWWMIGIALLSYPGLNAIGYNAYKELLSNEGTSMIVKMLGNPFAFPQAWHTVTYFSSFFIFIPAVVVIMFITNEYTYKTHRQNVIDGWSREQFMSAKMVDVLIVSFLTTLICTLVALVVGSMNIADGAFQLGNEIKYIPLFFLQTFSQLSLAFLIAFLARKAFIALGIFIVYYLIIENIAVAVLKRYVNDVGAYLPFEISDRILPPPAFIGKTAGRNRGNWYEVALSQVNPHIIYTILLIILTWLICFWINKKRDL